MIEYFQHDYHSRNDPKLIKIEIKLGRDGRMTYWDLIEMLYENNGKLLLSGCETYAFALRTQYERIQDLIYNFDVFQISECGTYFYSNGVNKRLALRGNKSDKARESVNKRWEKVRTNNERNTNVIRTHVKRNTRKEKNKIEEEENNKNSSLQEKKEEKESNKNHSLKSVIEINIPFDVFWEHYDKKVGDKKKLIPKWERLKDEERALAMEHIAAYKLAQPDKAYRKDPSTYLNNKSFNDEIIRKSYGAQNARTSTLPKRGGTLDDLAAIEREWELEAQRDAAGVYNPFNPTSSNPPTLRLSDG